MLVAVGSMAALVLMIMLTGFPMGMTMGVLVNVFVGVTH